MDRPAIESPITLVHQAATDREMRVAGKSSTGEQRVAPSCRIGRIEHRVCRVGRSTAFTNRIRLTAEKRRSETGELGRFFRPVNGPG